MNPILQISSVAVATIVGLTLVHVRPSIAATSTEYALTTVQLLDAPGGKAIATISPGTAATVDAQQNGASKVTIAGFAQAGSTSLLYAAAGQRIVLASALNASASKFAPNGATQNISGAAWRPATIQGFIVANGLGANVAPVWQWAQTLLGARCSTCHAVPAVTAYSANAWPGMVKAMVHNAGLSVDQTTLITEYLQTKSLSGGH